MPKMNVDHVWYDGEKTVAERVDALVGAMTLREKIAQMLHQAPPIPRLGVPAYNWWNECLHGVGRAGRATVFPQSIGMAATFNVPLAKRVATTISDEARVKHHQALKRENRGIYFGLTYWTPNINIFRDPRWGRGQETYGECPYLTARMGVAFVKGMQGNDPTTSSSWQHRNTTRCTVVPSRCGITSMRRSVSGISVRPICLPLKQPSGKARRGR
jgi:beta-glucosidase